ncbi:unnamed protein product [Blepharisma stoltei]|uniref:Uncharacterized protein n=1 Tax=Blepharisma stoltei TaxID=1481888 RepID=A0AAU9JXC9_9CILI|nr:unnamed protein product [Blepharisma stoltei]
MIKFNVWNLETFSLRFFCSLTKSLAITLTELIWFCLTSFLISAINFFSSSWRRDCSRSSSRWAFFKPLRWTLNCSLGESLKFLAPFIRDKMEFWGILAYGQCA